MSRNGVEFVSSLWVTKLKASAFVKFLRDLGLRKVFKAFFT